MKIGRNDPCPCGSGRKYKKCCLEKDRMEEKVLELDEINELNITVITKASHFIGTPKYQKETAKSLDIFFDVGKDECLDIDKITPVDSVNFMAWFIYDYILEKEKVTPLNLFLQKRGGDITENERRLIKYLVDSHLSLYEVLDVEHADDWIEIEDVFSSGIVELEESDLADFAGVGGLFALRIMDWDGHVFCGTDAYYYPKDTAEMVMTLLKKNLIDTSSIILPSLNKILKQKGHVFNHIRMAIDPEFSAVEKIPKEEILQLREEKREPEKTCIYVARSHFIVENFEKAKQGLDSSNLVNIKKSGEGIIEYAWSKTPSRALIGMEDALIKLTKRKLLLETTAPDSIENIRNTIQKELKPHIKYMFDDLEKRRSFAFKN